MPVLRSPKLIRGGVGVRCEPMTAAMMAAEGSAVLG